MIARPLSAVTPAPTFHLAEWPTEEFASLGRKHIKNSTNFGEAVQWNGRRLINGLRARFKSRLTNAIFLGYLKTNLKKLPKYRQNISTTITTR